MRITSLVWKEILATMRDPKSRLSILLPPIFQLILFAPAATLDVKNVPIGVLNRDHGKESFELVQRLRGSPFFSKVFYLSGVEEIKPFMDTQKGCLVVSIDEQFSRNLCQDQPVVVQVLLDGRKTNTAQILSGYIATILQKFGEDFAREKSLPEENVQIVPRFWYNPNALYIWYNIPSLVCTLSMLACLVVTTQSIARERELGTFDQLLISPLGTTEILLGKMIPGILIGILEGFFLVFMGIVLFDVPFMGSFFLFVLSQCIFVSAISGIGLFISSLCTTQQQAMLGTFVFVLPSILLSGFATPIENMPTWLQPVTYLNPLKYMLINTKGIFLKAIPYDIVLNNIWPMMVIGFCTIAIAAFSFRRRLQYK